MPCINVRLSISRFSSPSTLAIPGTFACFQLNSKPNHRHPMAKPPSLASKPFRHPTCQRHMT